MLHQMINRCCTNAASLHYRGSRIEWLLVRGPRDFVDADSDGSDFDADGSDLNSEEWDYEVSDFDSDEFDSESERL
jgi:hypothetical protein